MKNKWDTPGACRRQSPGEVCVSLQHSRIFTHLLPAVLALSCPRLPGCSSSGGSCWRFASARHEQRDALYKRHSASGAPRRFRHALHGNAAACIWHDSLTCEHEISFGKQASCGPYLKTLFGILLISIFSTSSHHSFLQDVLYLILSVILLICAFFLMYAPIFRFRTVTHLRKTNFSKFIP